MSTAEATGPNRPYYYYPAYGLGTDPKDPKRIYARRVLAGIVSEGNIYVGEARCFTGGGWKDADQFNKKRGRQIAEGRAYCAAGYALQEGKWVKTDTKCTGKAVLVIPVPSDCQAIGKLFVSEIEKIYPKHVAPAKAPKGEPAPEYKS